MIWITSVKLSETETENSSVPTGDYYLKNLQHGRLTGMISNRQPGSIDSTTSNDFSSDDIKY